MSKTLKYLLGFLGVLILLFVIYTFRSLIVYILIAAVLSLVGAPLVKLLSKIKIRKFAFPKWLAALITLTSFVLLIVLFLSMFAPLVAEQANSLSKIDVEKTVNNIEGSLSKTEDWLSQFNLSGDQRSNREFILSTFKDSIQLDKLSQAFGNIFGLLGNAFIAIVSILFISFFFLKDNLLLRRIVFTITPDRFSDEMKNILKNSHNLLTRYFVGIIIQVSIITILISVGLQIVGIKQAILIGFLAGIVNLIPYVGPLIGAAIGILITIIGTISGIEPQDMLAIIAKVAVVFAIVQVLDNIIFQPIIFSNSVNAHPLEIFIVISMAGTVGGILGMILAIPVYTFLRIIAKEFLSGFKVVNSLTRNI